MEVVKYRFVCMLVFLLCSCTASQLTTHTSAEGVKFCSVKFYCATITEILKDNIALCCCLWLIQSVYGIRSIM